LLVEILTPIERKMNLFYTGGTAGQIVNDLSGLKQTLEYWTGNFDMDQKKAWVDSGLNGFCIQLLDQINTRLDNYHAETFLFEASIMDPLSSRYSAVNFMSYESRLREFKKKIDKKQVEYNQETLAYKTNLDKSLLKRNRPDENDGKYDGWEGILSGKKIRVAGQEGCDRMTDAEKRHAEIYNREKVEKDESMLKNQNDYHIVDDYMHSCRKVGGWVNAVDFIGKWDGPEWFKKIAVEYSVVPSNSLACEQKFSS
jgi:hypothetical protein